PHGPMEHRMTQLTGCRAKHRQGDQQEAGIRKIEQRGGTPQQSPKKCAEIVTARDLGKQERAGTQDTPAHHRHQHAQCASQWSATEKKLGELAPGRVTATDDNSLEGKTGQQEALKSAGHVSPPGGQSVTLHQPRHESSRRSNRLPARIGSAAGSPSSSVTACK